MHENNVARIIIDVAFDIHRMLGPGLLESVYEAVMVHELRKRGLSVRNQIPIGVTWDNQKLDIGFRADLIVENLVIVELKSIETILPVHKKIVLTYLKIADRRLGLLINFGMELLKDGITRVVNRLDYPN